MPPRDSLKVDEMLDSALWVVNSHAGHLSQASSEVIPFQTFFFILLKPSNMEQAGKGNLPRNMSE